MLCYPSPRPTPSVSQGVDKVTYRLENGLIGLVINPISEWVVNSIILAFASPNILIKRDIKVKLKDEARKEFKDGARRLRKEVTVLGESSWAMRWPGQSRVPWVVSFPALASPAHISRHTTEPVPRLGADYGVRD